MKDTVMGMAANSWRREGGECRKTVSARKERGMERVIEREQERESVSPTARSHK